MPPHRCSCPICATRTTKRVVSKPRSCLWAPTLTIFWAYETDSLYMPMSLYTYIYIYIYYDIYRYMCVCVNIYIYNTITHPLQPLKKNKKPGHPWNSSGPNASDAKALWRAPFPQPGEHSRHKPWLDQMDRTFPRCDSRCSKWTPTILPWNQWNQWNNGLIFWAFCKGCGAYRRR